MMMRISAVKSVLLLVFLAVINILSEGAMANGVPLELEDEELLRRQRLQSLGSFYSGPLARPATPLMETEEEPPAELLNYPAPASTDQLIEPEPKTFKEQLLTSGLPESLKPSALTDMRHREDQFKIDQEVIKRAWPLVTKAEGFEEEAYPDPASEAGKAKAAGKPESEWKLLNGEPWTIGFGRTEGVEYGDKTTIDAEEKWTNDRLSKDVNYIRSKGLSPTESLVSLIYNTGRNVLNSGSLVQKLKDGNYKGYADTLEEYNKAYDEEVGGLAPLPGLIRRRRDEANIARKAFNLEELPKLRYVPSEPRSYQVTITNKNGKKVKVTKTRNVPAIREEGTDKLVWEGKKRTGTYGPDNKKKTGWDWFKVESE